MTDREMLEMAAKAAGLTIDKSPFNGGGSKNTGFDFLGNAVLNWHTGEKWNPLTDDKDALRLAVKLEMVVDTLQRVIGGYPSDICIEIDRDDQEKDPYAATRRAITRAAAEIGKAMK